MDAKVLATGDIMKIETEEVGINAVEADTKLFQLDSAPWKLESDDIENTKDAVLNRIPVPEIADQINIKQETDNYFVDDLASRSEHNYVKLWMKSEAEEELMVDSYLGDSEKHPVREIMEEFIIKDQCFNNDDTLQDTNAETVSNSVLNREILKKQHPVLYKKSSSKSFNCHNCNYSARFKNRLVRHMKVHTNQKSRNMHRFSYKNNTCKHCDVKFVNKNNLDDHVIRKHPNLVATVSSKIHKCSYCVYKTTSKGSYVRHMLKHPESVRNYKFSICIHCNAKFIRKTTLNDHIIRKHPDFIPSVSSKIHKCSYCVYKTTSKSNFVKHMMRHPETGDNYNLSICIHCNAKFSCKVTLNDHIIRIHPEFIASVCNKIHVCAHCAYKTTIKSSLDRHMLKHPETEVNLKFNICIHCKAKCGDKIHLDNHIIRKHPDFIASVSSKIHECTHCAYKTTLKSNLARHMLQHPELVGNYKFSICIHCNAQFRSKATLNDHIIRIHPDFIASVSCKINVCTHCAYQTTIKSNFDRHQLKHST